MRLGVLKEGLAGERRVALSPTNVAKIIKSLGFEIVVESGAGEEAGFSNGDYETAGATVHSQSDVYQQADILLQINPPTKAQVPRIAAGKSWISLLSPATNGELCDGFVKGGVTAFSLDAVPRISRAQKMDVLSSMANIAGYRAVLEAAHNFGSFFTGQITAAGKVAPAKVLVIGAGVAGLAAIGAAKGLGAIVRAFDTRMAVKDQVKSLGGEFLVLDFEESGEGAGGYAKTMSKEFIDAEMAMFRKQAKEVDIVITTALIPGKKAPILWTKDMVESMKTGSVVVDLAAGQGGNCELSEDGKIVDAGGVKIIGYSDMPSRMPTVSSELFGTNVYHFLSELGGAENFNVDLENEVIRGAVVAHEGELLWPPPKVEPSPVPKPAPVEPTPEPVSVQSAVAPSKFANKAVAVLGLLAAVGWLALRFSNAETTVSPGTFLLLKQITVFVLACFVGWQVVWNVTAALHTPLMSVTNAISGIIIVGGLLQMNDSMGVGAPLIVGAAAILLATINIAGGFFVTHRMLKMFRK